ncbi:c-type cytochrome [Campylobacter insulaenigrae]|uniref:C-type cytochrome n=1 Tax=Campylobacter insulaenigrae TaxID=260714 RepID=A0ABY3G4K6_9BACT|nr:c-type cytochrome [Campylobacter insulaenigrae]TWO24685.1 c-type cytochrome [Campylobacter insulaenigrae]
MLRLILFVLFFTNSLMAFNVKSLLTYTFNGNTNYDTQKAKKIYFDNKCNVCHGDNGEKSNYGKRSINSLTPAQIKGSLKDYANGYYPNSNTDNIQMGIYAKRLSDSDMDHIIAYLKGQNFSMELNREELLEEEPKAKTKHGIFLK